MKICQCLYDLVLLSDSCENSDRCDSFIDTLPGIDKGDFERLTNQYQQTVADVWEDVQTNAIQKIRLDLMAAFAAKMEVRRLIEDITTGEWDQPFDLIPNSNKYIGYKIELRASRNLEAYIDSVDIFANSASTGAIKIFDLTTGAELYSKAFTGIQGFNRIEIGKTFIQDRLFVCYNASEIQTRQVTVNPLDFYKGLCSSCRLTPTFANAVEVGNADDVIYSNLSNADDVGMIVKYSVGCTIDNWICRNKHLIAPGLRFLLATEFFMALIASKNVNMSTLISVEKLDGVMGYAQANYNKWLSNLKKSVHIEDPLCVKCKSSVRKVGIIN